MEQQRILSVEVANHFIALQRLSEEAARDGNKESIKVEMTKLNDEIIRTNKQISLLEDQTTSSVVSSPHHKMDDVEYSRSIFKLEAQLNEKSLELEVQIRNNQVVQEQLNQKNYESKELQETISALKQQISEAHDLKSLGKLNIETENTTINDRSDMLFQQAQALEIEQLKQKVAKLTESKEQLEAENERLAEESSYAKELASAAATELKALSEEVMKLMNNNERLSTELPPQNHSPTRQTTIGPTKKKQQSSIQLELKRELALSKEREMAYEAILSEKYRKESELQETVKESKKREAYLENEVANMWILVSSLRKSQESETNVSESNRERPMMGGFEI